MGASYVLLLIAFCADNGKQLPIWKDLPHCTYWLFPAAGGGSLISPHAVMASSGKPTESALIERAEPRRCCRIY